VNEEDEESLQESPYRQKEEIDKAYRSEEARSEERKVL